MTSRRRKRREQAGARAICTMHTGLSLCNALIAPFARLRGPRTVRTYKGCPDGLQPSHSVLHLHSDDHLPLPFVLHRAPCDVAACLREHQRIEPGPPHHQQHHHRPTPDSLLALLTPRQLAVMGMRYRQYLAGARIYGCLACKTHLATIHCMVSRVRPARLSPIAKPSLLTRSLTPSQAFTGQHGRAYLFDGV